MVVIADDTCDLIDIIPEVEQNGGMEDTTKLQTVLRSVFFCTSCLRARSHYDVLKYDTPKEIKIFPKILSI